MNRATVAGFAAAVLATVVAQWAFAASMCRSDGVLVSFATHCVVRNCEPFPLTNYVPSELAIVAFVLVGWPMGFLVYSTVARLIKPLPRK